MKNSAHNAIFILTFKLIESKQLIDFSTAVSVFAFVYCFLSLIIEFFSLSFFPVLGDIFAPIPNNINKSNLEMFY